MKTRVEIKQLFDFNGVGDIPPGTGRTCGKKTNFRGQFCDSKTVKNGAAWPKNRETVENERRKRGFEQSAGNHDLRAPTGQTPAASGQV
ncbi:MAG: hypothetical protein VXZ09_01670 [Pseudomonadota bacterium]|nr:hypothetical protein [Pseudomonadota bacterium]